MARIAMKKKIPVELRARMFAELSQHVTPKRKALKLSADAGAIKVLLARIEYRLDEAADPRVLKRLPAKCATSLTIATWIAKLQAVALVARNALRVTHRSPCAFPFDYPQPCRRERGLRPVVLWVTDGTTSTSGPSCRRLAPGMALAIGRLPNPLPPA
jgi:hypothetical protein